MLSGIFVFTPVFNQIPPNWRIPSVLGAMGTGAGVSIIGFGMSLAERKKRKDFEKPLYTTATLVDTAQRPRLKSGNGCQQVLSPSASRLLPPSQDQ
jgi:hypothetical protein